MTKDTSLHKYLGLFRGKLDWTLLRGFHVLAKGMDNHDFKASDHKLLYLVVRPCTGRTKKELQGEVEKAYHDGRVPRNFYFSIIKTLVTAMILAYLYVTLRDLYYSY
jgi:hypothetical protein